MTRALLLLLPQTPDAHYAGGASSKVAGTTAVLGKFFRFLMSDVPQWVQIAGVIVGGPIAIIVAWQAWKHRREIWAWWMARPRPIKVTFLAAAGVIGLAGVSSGTYGYNYMMHDNDFCQSCHIMDTAWNRFQVSAHKDLQCHACHRQPLYVSSVELFWWVTRRQMDIPAHDKVPNAVCSECHMRAGTDSARTLVTLTAGHAVHLKSDSSALKNVQCVTCHGIDFHVFKPDNRSCTQSGCHTGVRVNLGAMSNQGFPHCATCHNFKNRVPEGISVADAKRLLFPKSLDCLSCHVMTTTIRAFDLAADPHKGTCGMCHDAHKQQSPKDAYKTCSTAQCHPSAATLTAFHRGLGGHKLDQCGACHQAHSWKVRGSDCLACHKTINGGPPGASPAAAAAPGGITHRSVQDDQPPQSLFQLASFVRSAPAPRGTQPQPPPRQASDSFSHPIHKALGCTDCHSTATSHAALKFKAPAGCLACHHGQQQRTPCTSCHKAESRPEQQQPLPAPDSSFRHSIHTTVACADCHGTSATRAAVKFTAPGGCFACHHGTDQRAPCTTCHAASPTAPHSVAVPFVVSARRDTVTRPITFVHARHSAVACATCHGAGVTRVVSPVTCTTCHADHHTAAVDCASCHPSARTGHDRDVHAGCAGCHTDARMSALPTSRPLCLVCHQEQRNHYPTGDCATCHALNASAMLRTARSRSGR